MEIKNSIIKRRTGVLISFLSLASIVFIFEFSRIEGRDKRYIILEIIPIISFLISFIFIYVRTGLWKFTHKPINDLDEREIALTGKSLRYAYSIFTTIVLFILLVFSLTNIQFSIVFVVTLLLFAHILPASIIAWFEKEI